MTIQNYLIELSKTYSPSSLLDIGAHYGEFSRFCFSLWSNIEILMIEGNEKCISVLETLPFEHKISLLSDLEKEVTLYLNPSNLACTGTSYYKERTRHYKNSVEVKVKTSTLDQILNKVKKTFDIIKIDTQGSELDIIKGGLNIVKNASYIIMEVPTLQYNEGSPLFGEVIEYMNSIGFTKHEIVEEHIWMDKNENTFEYGKTFQVDVVFSK